MLSPIVMNNIFLNETSNKKINDLLVMDGLLKLLAEENHGHCLHFAVDKRENLKQNNFPS